MPAMVCPTAEQLAAFDAGKLNHDELNQIAEHLELCAACKSPAKIDVAAAEPLLQGLSTGPEGDPYAAESGCERAVAKVRELVAKGVSTMDNATGAAETSDDGTMPTAFGVYQIDGYVDKGGMGVIYKATHMLMQTSVALKILSPARMKNAQAVARFHREIEAAAQLDHVNIVRTINAGEVDGQHFLVMELLDGVDLHKLVSQVGPLSVEKACEYTRQAALGLEYAHCHKIVHRDVKPRNLLLTTNADGTPRVKVLDWGLAKLRDTTAGTRELTNPDQIMGDLNYLAPEQARAANEVDGRADIYGLGSTFYYLLTGFPPFPAGNATQKLTAHQLEEPKPVAEIRADVPAQVIAIVQKMMEKEPTKRFKSMKEVAETLAALTTVSPFSSAVSEIHVLPPRCSGSERPRVSGPRRPLLVAASVALGLLAVVALGLVAVAALVFGIIRITTPEVGTLVETADAIRRPSFAVVPAKDEAFKIGELLRFEKHQTPVHCVAFVDNQRVVSGSGAYMLNDARNIENDPKRTDCSLYVWDPTSGAEIRRLEYAAPVRRVAISKEGKRALTATGYVIEHWGDGLKYITPRRGLQLRDLDGKDKASEWNLPGRGEVMNLAFADESFGYVSTSWAEVYSVHLTTGQAELVGASHASDSAPIYHVATAFARDFKSFVFAGQNHALNRSGGAFKDHEGQPYKWARCLAYHAEADLVVTGGAYGDKTLRLWDAKAGKQLHVWPSKSIEAFTCLVFSSDGKRVLSGHTDGVLILWDVEKRQEIQRFPGHTGPISCVAFSPDGRRAVSGSGDKTVRVWGLPK